MNKGTDAVTITAFRAAENSSLAARYLRAHHQVLQEFGVLDALKLDQSWTSSCDHVVLVAEHTRLGLIAGMRIQRRAPQHLLPMEHALRPLVPDWDELMSPYLTRKCGEVCGLWGTPSASSLGLPALLSLAAVSLAPRADFESLFCLVAHYTRRHAKKVGFCIMNQVGDDGAVLYPIPQIRSYAMILADTVLVESAPEASRAQIFQLRRQPEHDCLQGARSEPYRLSYRLEFDKKSHESLLWPGLSFNEKLGVQW